MKNERTTTRVAWLQAGVAEPKLPALVKLCRISPGSRRLDGDNLQSALKGVRDELAAIFGIDDGSPDVAWSYEQRRGKEFAVEVSISEIVF